MRAEGLPDVVIETFRQYYEQLVRGETGLIPEAALRPVDALPDAEQLPEEDATRGREALSASVVIKLNGGLGTSMGLDRAKSLLRVRDDLTFLDVIAMQARHAGARLLLMDSFATRDDSLAALQRHSWLAARARLDFLQHRVPRVRKADLLPATCPQHPSLEWCPPGHGDIYTALLTSGTLDELLADGVRYAFVSNADNLGAVLDERLLGHFAGSGNPFMMEVADRTEADRKGGHLARRGDGRLLLREAAQCAPDDQDAFKNVRRHRYFNTNNLWLDLQALRRILTERKGVLGLPMIRNEKTLDPRDPTSAAVYQLETAMGAAIEVFDGAAAIRVPRTRFAPVKTTDDLLAVRSDAYVLTPDYRLVLDASRAEPPVVRLDPRYYKLVDALDAHFPEGPPSLRACRGLKVSGEWIFGKGVVVEGDVSLACESVSRVPDGAVLRPGR